MLDFLVAVLGLLGVFFRPVRTLPTFSSVQYTEPVRHCFFWEAENCGEKIGLFAVAVGAKPVVNLSIAEPQHGIQRQQQGLSRHGQYRFPVYYLGP